MSESDLAERLDAVERALTDDETDLTDVRDRAALSSEVDRLETRIAELEATVDELEAAVEAVRGYAGNVRAVNREVERRASAALAKAETLETAVDGAESTEAVETAEGVKPSGRDDRATVVETGADDDARRQPRTGGRNTATDAAQAQTGPDTEVPTGRTDDRPAGADPSGSVARRETVEDGPAGGSSDRTNAAGSPRAGQHASDRGSVPEQQIDETGTGNDASGQTEQFIERVRDAL